MKVRRRRFIRAVGGLATLSALPMITVGSKKAMASNWGPLVPDPDGVLEFRAVTALGGRLSVSRDPVRRIEVDALGAWVEATDLDGDGVVDLLIRKEDQVEVYVARKR